ncbi:MAG: hypothetical protein IT353_04270 [Gemmatimonadaceae bacterium]|nr:hypothetical protein [Gemmatimonadaceae bacterium]
MRTLSGLLWALGGGVVGLLVGGLIGVIIAKVTEMPSREGASAYFALLIALAGAVIGIVAGVVMYGRSAPSGQSVVFVGSSALGILGLVSAVALATWAYSNLRETPALYDGAMASLELELRVRQTDIPVGSDDGWVQVEVQTANTRPEGDVQWSRARTEGDMRIIPVSQNPLIRATNRVIVVRIRGRHHELFVPPMKRLPDRAVDWSPWYDATSVEATDQSGTPSTLSPIISLRYRIKVYGE